MNLTFNELKEKLLATKAFIDNEHLDQYCELIILNKCQEKIKYQTQSHHIIPKCYFTAMGEEIDNSKENLVNLLYKDHILAHYHLYKCVLKELSFLLIRAYIMLFNFGGGDRSKCYLQDLSKEDLIIAQKFYEDAKKDFGESLLGVKQSEETCEKKRIAKIGFSHSEESKKLMHDIKMAIPKERFDSIYASISEQRKGSVWVYNELLNEYKIAHRDKVEEYLSQGWVKQAPTHSKESYQRAAEKKRQHHRNDEQKQNHSIGHKGKIFINKEEECIMIYPNDLENYLAQGWVRGRLSRK